jgi:hypothetical protein
MITLATADALEALGLAIFNPEIVPNPNPALGNHWGKGVGLTGQDDATDAQLYSLLAEVIKTIDGRTMRPGLKLTLNYTNATQCSAYHWYLSTQQYDGSGYGWPASAFFEFHPQPGAVVSGAQSWGGSVGLAVCAASCKVWAAIIRTWLAGNYPLAVNQPT